jgi:ribosomal protein S18 acetylase RimI-like enzyme
VKSEDNGDNGMIGYTQMKASVRVGSVRRMYSVAQIADVTICRGSVVDAAELAVFAARTFKEAFSANTQPDDMQAHLAASYGLAQQAAELADPLVATILARSVGKLVAYAQVRQSSPPPPCVTHADPIELHRFYVDSRAHGSGLAPRLMDEAHRAAREFHGRHIWLSVWDQNPRGIAFYKKTMFVDVGSTFYMVGPDKQLDRVLVSALAAATTRHLDLKSDKRC